MRLTSQKAVAGLALLFLAAATAELRAQEPDVPPLGQPILFVPAVHRDRAVMAIGAGRPDHVFALLAATANVEEQSLTRSGATLAGQARCGPFAVWTMLTAANRAGVVPLPEAPQPFEPDRPVAVEVAEPLLAHLLQGVRDDKPFAKNWNENEDEQFAFSKVLFAASGISAEAFRKGASKDLTYAHVFNQPSRYRGQIVHVEGTLRQVRRFDPPATAKAAGVANLYEGWIFDPKRFGADPWCVVFTDLPTGITPGDKLSYSVSFDGYFFKRYLYESRNTNKPEHWRKAPLLVGRTVTLTAAPAAPAEAESDWAGSLVPIFLGLVVGSIALAFGLGYWFRRGDRRVRQRLTTITDREFVEPGSNDELRTMNDEPERVQRSLF
ncbi:MAG TPA: hypothetical protein VKE94_23025 [Gemmataceae bacterium]|nr:hypothetical protein [Gemmataceae bacterium]